MGRTQSRMAWTQRTSGVKTTDLWMLGIPGITILLLAFLASTPAAIRAVHIDPAQHCGQNRRSAALYWSALRTMARKQRYLKTHRSTRLMTRSSELDISSFLISSFTK